MVKVQELELFHPDHFMPVETSSVRSYPSSLIDGVNGFSGSEFIVKTSRSSGSTEVTGLYPDSAQEWHLEEMGMGPSQWVCKCENLPLKGNKKVPAVTAPQQLH